MADWIGAGEDVAGEEGEEKAVGEEDDVEALPAILHPLVPDQGEAQRVPQQLPPSVFCHQHHGVVPHQHVVTFCIWLPKTFHLLIIGMFFLVLCYQSLVIKLCYHTLISYLISFGNW